MYQKVNYTKSKNTAQPVRVTSDIAIYMDKEGANILWDMKGKESLAPVINGETLERLPIKRAEESDYKIEYSRRGAKNHGVVVVEVKNSQGKIVNDVKWILFRGYTGMQLRHLQAGQKAETVFALAKEDAFMFCTADPCLECNFGCLVGMEIYAYSESQGLIWDGFKKIRR